MIYTHTKGVTIPVTQRWRKQLIFGMAAVFVAGLSAFSLSANAETARVKNVSTGESFATIQAAIDELMNRIEPGELQERFDRGLKRGAILGAANRMKYWDLYVEFYQALNQRNEQGLPVLFAEELARTYAERAAPKKK